MKKMIIILIFIGLLIFGGFYLKQRSQYNKIVKANVELICYQETNRLTPIYMRADGLSNTQIKENLKKVMEKDDEIAKKYGFESGEDLRLFVSKNLSKKKLEKMMNESEKKVKDTCNPNYKNLF